MALLSELIKALQEIKKAEGDLSCYVRKGKTAAVAPALGLVDLEDETILLIEASEVKGK